MTPSVLVVASGLAFSFDSARNPVPSKQRIDFAVHNGTTSPPVWFAKNQNGANLNLVIAPNGLSATMYVADFLPGSCHALVGVDCGVSRDLVVIAEMRAGVSCPGANGRQVFLSPEDRLNRLAKRFMREHDARTPRREWFGHNRYIVGFHNPVEDALFRIWKGAQS